MVAISGIAKNLSNEAERVDIRSQQCKLNDCLGLRQSRIERLKVSLLPLVADDRRGVATALNRGDLTAEQVLGIDVLQLR